MSLFDVDDDELSSVSSEGNVPTSSTPAPPSQQQPALTADEIRARMGLPGRYAVTASDAARSAERQRAVIAARLCGPTGNAAASNAGLTVTGSKFGSSIAAALQMRMEDQAQRLVERVRKQRELDANTPELVEKDLDVGIFVTPAYKQTLKTHYKAAAKKTRQLRRGDGDGSTTSEDDEESTDKAAHDECAEVEDALDAYLKQFTPPSRSPRQGDSSDVGDSVEGRAAADDSSSLDFYTASMRQAVRDDAMQAQQQAQQQPQQILHQDPQCESVCSEHADEPVHATASSVAPPSLDELQALLGLSGLPAAAAALPSPPAESTTTDVAPSRPDPASRDPAGTTPTSHDHLSTLFRAREARKRKRADETFIEGCAQRCNARLLRSIRAQP